MLKFKRKFRRLRVKLIVARLCKKFAAVYRTRSKTLTFPNLLVLSHSGVFRPAHLLAVSNSLFSTAYQKLNFRDNSVSIENELPSNHSVPGMGRKFPSPKLCCSPSQPLNGYLWLLPEGHCGWYVKLTSHLQLMLRLGMTAATSQPHVR